MSAVAGESPEPIQVLFTLHHNMNTLDFAGPLEVFSRAQHNPKDENTKAFDVTLVAAEEHTLTYQGASLQAQISYKEAHKRLNEFDLLVVAGGGAAEILKEKAEPVSLIRAFADLQEGDPTRERSILTVGTASHFLGATGCLQGLSATTHPDHFINLELICQESSQKSSDARTDVIEGERYIVNNGRFDLGDNLEDNPYVFRRNKPSQDVRKGSEQRKMSMAKRENIVRRAEMRLGGMRVVTAGGAAAGLDASFYLVSALVNHEIAVEVGRQLQYKWTKGLVVDSIDV